MPKFESCGNKAVSTISKPIIISYTIGVEGWLHNLLNGTGSLIAYIKIIGADQAQVTREYKSKSKRYKARLKDGKLIVGGKPLNAVNADKVIAALKHTKPYRVPGELDPIGNIYVMDRQIYGLCNNIITDDIDTPGRELVVIVNCPICTPHFVSHRDHRRVNRVCIAFDATKDKCYEVLTTTRKVIGKKVADIGLEYAIQKSISHKVAEFIESWHRSNEHT